MNDIGLSQQIQVISNDVKIAREMAILGDYEKSIAKFKHIFSIVHNYSKRYENGPSQGSGYAAMTSSAAKKANGKA